jgi:cyclic lactone autoinducer peptide
VVKEVSSVFLIEILGTVVEKIASTLSMACFIFVFEEPNMPEELIK